MEFNKEKAATDDDDDHDDIVDNDDDLIFKAQFYCRCGLRELHRQD